MPEDIVEKNYTEMSTEDLTKMNEELMQEKEAIRQRQQEIRKVLDERGYQAPEPAPGVGGESVVIRPEGIASEEDVGTPGG